MKYIIGIDIGTSSTKTVLFDEDFNFVCSSTIEYPLYQPQNGWAEQNSEDWKNASINTIKNVIQKSGVNGDDIVSIGLSGQMHGLVMLDENNQVIRNAIIWCDQRTAKECQEITNRVGADRLIEITANPPLTGFTASKILWVRNNEKENFERCKHILLPKDYIRFILTGDYATDVSDASGMQILDVKNRCWSDEILQKLELDKSLFAKVYESVDVTGHITKAIAEKTGLSTKTVVVAGAGDNAAAGVGTGIVEEGKAFTTIGTSGVVFAHTNKPIIDRFGRVHTFCCAVPNCWHVMGVTQAAGLSLKWFKDNFCQDIIEMANQENTNVYALMDKMAEESGVGANKLIYLPYLMGERTPHLDADCRGVFFGLSAIHNKADMIRAVMEGVAFSLKDCLNILEEMNINIDTMMACGGGGTSSLWRQILSDMFDVEVKTIKSKEGPALGVAILGSVGAGLYKDIKSACDKAIKEDKTTTAIKDNNKKYEMLYEVYQNLYKSLKNDYKKLAEIKL